MCPPYPSPVAHSSIDFIHNFPWSSLSCPHHSMPLQGSASANLCPNRARLSEKVGIALAILGQSPYSHILPFQALADLQSTLDAELYKDGRTPTTAEKRAVYYLMHTNISNIGWYSWKKHLNWCSSKLRARKVAQVSIPIYSTLVMRTLKTSRPQLAS